MNMSIFGPKAKTFSNISFAVSTLTRLTKGGVGRLTGPLTSVTFAPAAMASEARAYAIFPEL